MNWTDEPNRVADTIYFDRSLVARYCSLSVEFV